MRVLVTGGAGYIGSNMVLGLLDRGDHPVIIDSLVTGYREAIPEGVAFYQGDIADETLVGKVLREEKSKPLYISPPLLWCRTLFLTPLVITSTIR